MPSLAASRNGARLETRLRPSDLLVHLVATKFKIRSNLHLFEPPRAPRTQKGNPSRHLESENLKSRILDPDGRPSTKGFIRQALSVLCVLGGSPFFGSRRMRSLARELAQQGKYSWTRSPPVEHISVELRDTRYDRVEHPNFLPKLTQSRLPEGSRVHDRT